MARLVGELDAACTPLLDAAQAIGARVWVVSEYGHVPVSRAVQPNRATRSLSSSRRSRASERMLCFFTVLGLMPRISATCSML